jgi:hypothetical protein
VVGSEGASRKMWEKFSRIDRRWIFLITAACVIIPFVFPVGLPLHVSPPVEDFYEKVDAIPEGSVVVIDFAFDASTLPELRPMAIGVMQHCFKRDIKVVLMSLIPPGIGIAQTIIDEVKSEMPDIEYGVDYVLMPYVYGLAIVILGMGENIHGLFPTDNYGTPIDSIPMLKEVHNYDDIALVVGLSGSGTPISWVVYANTRYNQEIAAGVTAVSAPSYYRYLQTGQLVGMLGGLKGAAEYETLVDDNMGFKGRKLACIGMDSQSAVHIMIIVFIVLGNVAFFATRKKK